MTYSPLTRRARALLQHLRTTKKATATNDQLATCLGVSKRTVNRALDELTDRNLICVTRTNPHPVENPSGRDIFARPRLVDVLGARWTEPLLNWGRITCLATHTHRSDACVDCGTGTRAQVPLVETIAAVAWNVLYDGDLDANAVNAFIELAPTWPGALSELVDTVNAAVSSYAAA